MARTVTTIRDMQKLVADHERLAADQEVARQDGIVREASGRLQQAQSEWDEYMASGRLMPEFMRALAEEVFGREQTYEAARHSLQSAERERDARTRRAELSAGLRKQAEQILKRAQRDVAAQDGARAQTALEERTAFTWSQT